MLQSNDQKHLTCVIKHISIIQILSSRTVKLYVFVNTDTPPPFPSQIKMTLQYLNQKKDKITLVFLRQWQKN